MNHLMMIGLFIGYLGSWLPLGMSCDDRSIGLNGCDGGAQGLAI